MIDPKINGATFGTYGGHLLSYEIGACEYSNGYITPPTSMIPVKLRHTLGLRGVTLTMDFEGETENDIALNIAEFIGHLYNGAEILLPDGFTYFCVFKKASTPIEKAPWIKQVKFTLEGYRHGALETETLSASGSIFVDGNCKTPAIIRITTASTSITILGITISNISGVIEIDSYKKTVKQITGGNGAPEVTTNKFADTNMTEFPKLSPGLTTVEISGTGNAATMVEISYYPIFI